MVEALGVEGSLQRLSGRCSEGGEARGIADVELQHRRLAARRLDLGYQGFGLGSAVKVGPDYADAAMGQVQRHAATQAAARASDDCDLLRHDRAFL
jgi:hypothetical protein